MDVIRFETDRRMAHCVRHGPDGSTVLVERKA